MLIRLEMQIRCGRYWQVSKSQQRPIYQLEIQSDFYISWTRMNFSRRRVKDGGRQKTFSKDIAIQGWGGGVQGDCDNEGRGLYISWTLAKISCRSWIYNIRLPYYVFCTFITYNIRWPIKKLEQGWPIFFRARRLNQITSLPSSPGCLLTKTYVPDLEMEGQIETPDNRMSEVERQESRRNSSQSLGLLSRRTSSRESVCLSRMNSREGFEGVDGDGRVSSCSCSNQSMWWNLA